MDSPLFAADVASAFELPCSSGNTWRSWRGSSSADADFEPRAEPRKN
jgi:hypothetical protein